MRKLSMKNAGMPDSEAENASGSGGVSADGDGAGDPLGAAGAFALERPPRDLACPPVAPAGAPGDPPWGCWTCSRGVPAAGALRGRGGGVGAGSTVSVGNTVLWDDELVSPGWAP